jgi:phenylacetate-CoA ligase
MSDRYLPYYVEELNRRRPPWIQGYPSLLALLAGYMETSHHGLTYRPRVVTIGAESLLPHQKQLIKRAFGADCRQHYGTTEAVANISECIEGRLHVDEDFSWVEFVPDTNESVRIIGTGFCNQAFVLLRYEVGDHAVLPGSNVACPCGNTGRIVDAIDGRIEDYVVTPDGRRIGRLDHILKDMVNVRECQILQEEIGRVEFRVVRGPRFTDRDRTTLLVEARRRLGDGVRIDLSYADALHRSKTGKLRFVVSKVAGGTIHHGAKDPP